MVFTKNRTVYIVDDDEDDRFLLKEAMLKLREHVQIIEFKSGSEMLIQLQDISQSFISLIILDMNMPKMNGLETICILKSYPAFACIPAVMFSTASSPALIASAYDAGVQDFFTKPVSISGLDRIAAQLTSKFLS